MTVSIEEMSGARALNLPAVMASKGITADALMCALKHELHAKETKLVKLKALPTLKQSERGDSNEVETHTTKRGRGKATAYRTIYEGGKMEDTVIAVDMVNWGVRQAARIDAQKLMGAYPASKVELGGAGGGPIPVTNFPPTAASLDEWQRQMEAAEKARMKRESADEGSDQEKIACPGQTSQANLSENATEGAKT